LEAGDPGRSLVLVEAVERLFLLLGGVLLLLTHDLQRLLPSPTMPIVSMEVHTDCSIVLLLLFLSMDIPLWSVTVHFVVAFCSGRYGLSVLYLYHFYDVGKIPFVGPFCSPAILLEVIGRRLGVGDSDYSMFLLLSAAGLGETLWE
jgi:hypothetical protein